MSATSVPGVKVLPASSRCHPFIVDFVVAGAATFDYMNIFQGEPADTYIKREGNAVSFGCFEIEGKASGKTVQFLPHDLLRAILIESRRDEPIVYCDAPKATELDGHQSSAMAELIEGLAQAMFTRYWETYSLAIKAKFGGARKDWPMVLQFANVVRDAMSHGGLVKFMGNVPPVSYFGLNLSIANNETKLIHNLVTSADIFYLMLDADKEF